MSQEASAPQRPRLRESFTGRTAFILVAVGSAVGLGNIWRFPYVTYENGGGAFLIPYLVALLTAGLPILLFDYAIGYRFRGSPPLAFKRLHPKAEAIGWFQVGICFLIAIYYAAIVAWAAMYTWFSLTQAWGDDAAGFFFGEYLQYDEGGTAGTGISVDFVAQVGWPLIVVWLILLAALAAGVRKGITRISLIGLPVLLLMFVLLVGFSNSSFELLAAIGVFAALGFLAAGAPLDEVAESGLGLAFIAFPTIIAEAPASALLGVLFFGSLAIAGLTSLISIMEVVVSSVKDKTGWSRPLAVAVAGGSAAVVSVTLIGGVSGLTILDVVDAFSNNIGIVSAALVAVFLVTWVFRRMDVLAEGLNAYGSFRVGPLWKGLIGVVLPVVLGYLLILDVQDKVQNGYEGYDSWVLGTFGWGALALMLVLAVGLSLLRWNTSSAMHLEDPETEEEAA